MSTRDQLRNNLLSVVNIALENGVNEMEIYSELDVLTLHVKTRVQFNIEKQLTLSFQKEQNDN